MRTVNSIHIDAGFDDVFRLAADVERWPELLPHYRWVRTIWRSDDTSLVEMAARRGWIPVKWTSVQHCARSESSIYYQHVGGPTRGMWVQWSLAPSRGGVDVTIVHELTLSHRVVGSRPGRWIVGRIFVEPIADRTLQHIKLLAEGMTSARAA